jgi:hypothetical protein
LLPFIALPTTWAAWIIAEPVLFGEKMIVGSLFAKLAQVYLAANLLGVLVLMVVLAALLFSAPFVLWQLVRHARGRCIT